ncbi:phosphotransferase [Paramaledivibacter caminithermalis]|jgi:predicted Ser/Thr protein kinase|uniref:Phosphotransferase enzyme family protein n=1 Tax=Paramaledivibacter caminithermalis (strain DSM 15212 / CIP 107654 / DViRD3) TaxID=1121301 RepID=A0A1M6MY63_PARC5|nr:phosphotransferase [Paramaledivibacter caminithermalis]SHJ88310.1 Phosphotransferase enzyme family protein [Paramaledivibacter caminithermalis DSM 15212]
MLKDTLKDKIKEYILKKKIFLDLKIDRSFNVDFLAQGEYNINFIIDDEKTKYVFRVNTGSQLELTNQISYEYNAIKALEISGVTPKVYFVDDTKEFFDYGILIMEFLEGRPLEYDKDLAKAAKIFAKIHSIDINTIGDCFIIEENICSDRILEGKRLLKNYLESPIVNKELKNFFYNFLNWAEKNRNREKYFIKNKWHVINNTEVNSHNFIIGDRSSYLIDWEKPVISDPCQDITQFLAPTTTLWKANYILTKEEKDNFFKTYIKSLDGGDKNIRERVHLYSPYLYLRALSWCAYAWLEYQKPDKNIKNMDTFRKIEQYLNIDFMKSLLKGYM